MIEFDPTRFKTPPFAHQVNGVKALLKHPAFALFDEMGAGKSKQVVDAACALAAAGEIDTVVIVCPASVRCVWLDFEIGEIRKHAWMPSSAWEFHSKIRRIWETGTKGLKWLITNYEFLRSAKNLDKLIFILGAPDTGKVLLVLDESSYIKSRTAQQTKAVMKLRQLCDRCVILNGTPITQSPLDLWSQMRVLDKNILGSTFKNFYHFRSEYCEMRPDFARGNHFMKVVSYRRLDDLSKRIKPYVLRREKKDCMDLPPKLYTHREVALTPESWKRYKELKRDALISIGLQNSVTGNEYVQLEPNAAVRIMRLAQLTSGILGSVNGQLEQGENLVSENVMQDLSSEKLDWAVKYLTEECTTKAVIVWCRWRRERERLVEALQNVDDFTAFELYGGQKKSEREAAVFAFSIPSNNPRMRSALIAQPHAGGFGLNLVAASEAIYLSNDFSLGIRLQSEDRMHRPGQNNPCLYVDVLATGPKGERTVDHAIVKALREKQNLAEWTTAKWRKELSDD